MTYATTLQVVRSTGIGVQIMNDNIGTGDNGTTSFDLANGNVIASSYTLKYGASGSNSFTDLTETTHYVINKDGGTIELEAAGVTALGTNVLYADYTHSPKVSDTIINGYLSSVDSEVDFTTKNYWGAPMSFTEYFDGRKSFTYPTTDQPFAGDWDEPDQVQLGRRNIVTIDGAYFLNRGMTIGQQFSFDTTLTSYTDNTSEANSMSGTGFNPFGATIAANDYCYIGTTYKFHGLNINNYIQGVTAGTNTIEYWNGSSWTAFTPTESTTGVLNFAANGSISWDPLSGWTKSSVNSSDSLYYIRFVANSTYSTNPSSRYLMVNQDLVIGEELDLYQMDADADGTVTFINKRIPNGTRNVRIDYTAGQTTTDPLVVELATILAGLRVYAAITGSSYDDATGFTLGRKTVSIGEVYVNVREVVRQYEIRKEQILDQLGRNYTVVA